MAILINGAPIDCINHAAIAYHVPATIILSVMKAEGGKNGMARLNRNGTIDYGIMQINSLWLRKIKPFGYTEADLQYNACKNIMVGTWILSQNIANGKTTWSGIGNYHSNTPKLGNAYSHKIYVYHHKISRIL